MRYKIIAGIFIIALFVQFTACSYEDTVGVKIDFATIVGQYNGNSVFCEKTHSGSDSICEPPNSNSMKIILLDLNTIIINDERKLFQQNKLYYVETTNSSNKRIHQFISADTSNVTLSYDISMNQLKVVRQDSGLSKKVSTTFFGAKK